MCQSGIYFITSISEPSKIYIGSAINLKQRARVHFSSLRSNKHFNSKIQNYYNKYGSGCLSFYVIQHVSPVYLIETEQFFIELLNPYFNINPVAGSRLGSKHSDKSKLLISRKMRERPNSYALRFFRYKIVKQGK